MTANLNLVLKRNLEIIQFNFEINMDETNSN